MDTEKNLETKTLDQLRALARATGARGYSGLRKKQLIELLSKQKARSSAQPKTAATTAKKTAKSKSPRASRAAPAATSAGTPAPAAWPTEPRNVAAEERIESAKFEITQPGARFAQPQLSTLNEDIDRLPVSDEPMLCLLPQKPGVVHAYWTLQTGAPVKDLMLRLCAVGTSGVRILEEIPLPGGRGHWYFQVSEQSEPGDLLLHLGAYDANGNFVTAIRRGIARIPSLYASARTDRAWWISDEDFRTMYLRGGGVTRGARLAWGEAAPGSPTNAPGSSSK